MKPSELPTAHQAAVALFNVCATTQLSSLRIEIDVKNGDKIVCDFKVVSVNGKPVQLTPTILN